jgi:hypothetical protein
MAQDESESRYKASQAAKERFEQELEDIDSRMGRLRVLYDQYFMGIEKLEPMTKRIELYKIFQRSQILRQGTTVLRFRYRSLQQRFTSYCSYWDRIVRLIEEGRIRRGVAFPAGEGKLPPTLEGDQRFAPMPEALATKRRRFRGRVKEGEEAQQAAVPMFGQSGPDLTRTEFGAHEVDQIYRRLALEKEKAGESIANLSKAVVEKSINRILEKVDTKDKEVLFRIVAQEGKVNLTAVLKKKPPPAAP